MSGRRPTSLPPDYFTAKYDADADPWKFATSRYEEEKYAATIEALPQRTYELGFEVGCSIGVLTRRLAVLCRRLLGVDVSERALRDARERCAGLNHVDFRRMEVPKAWPSDRFDLIVLSEVLYYFDPGDLAVVVDRVEGSLLPHGTVALVHWTGETDYPLTGDAAAEAFIAGARGFARAVRQDRTAKYRLDILQRSG